MLTKKKKYYPTGKEAAIKYIFALLDELPPDAERNAEFCEEVLCEAFPYVEKFTPKLRRDMADAYKIQAERVKNIFKRYLKSRYREKRKCHPTNISV